MRTARSVDAHGGPEGVGGGSPIRRRRTVHLLGRVSLAAAGVIVIALISGSLYQYVGSARDLRRHPAPGALVDLGSHRLHLHCTGAGGPTVVLAHAGGSLSAQWALVQPQLAEGLRVCSYDRAGFGWSDSPDPPDLPGGMAADARSAADELTRLLDASGESGPYLLVGHSFGSFVVEQFALLRANDVAGLVLLDPGYAIGTPGVPADVDAQMRTRDAGIIAAGPWLAGSGLFRVAAALGAMEAQRDLPTQEGSAFARMSLRTRHWETIRAEAGAMEHTSRQARTARARLPSVPLLVLSATTPDTRLRREWTAANERLAQSARGVHRSLPASDHMGLVLDAEQAAEVTAAILDLVGDLPGRR